MSHIYHIKKRKKGEHLKYEDRQRLELYIRENAYLPRRKQRRKKEIARLLGISRSTLWRELQRGEVKLLNSHLVLYKSYSAEVAQASYQTKGKAKGRALKIGRDYAFAQHVETKILKEGYSPDAVIMELKRDGNPYDTNICTRTLYSYIEKGVFLNLDQSSLPRAGRPKKRRYEPVRRAYRGDGKSIVTRPEAADRRSEMGHWEMDCIESGKGKSKVCLLSLVERMTRKLILIKLPSQTQDAVINALDRLETQLGAATFRTKFLTITTDNGSEFLNWRAVERSALGNTTRTQHYFTHPYSAWERGSNENINGMIRRFIPKGSDISKISIRRIKEIETWINQLPRRILNGQSAKTASARAEAA